MNKKVILVHGYFRNQKDMVDLKENLEIMGYQGILVDLPLTFEDIEYGSQVFNEKIEEIIRELKDDEKISLIGHSTGGLIIRLFLANTKHRDKIHRCVLIATPNNGSKLADMASKISAPLVKVFRTLSSLTSKGVEKLNLNHEEETDIGVIAGNKSNLILGKLLKSENDGRVELDSARGLGAKDYLVLPYGHKEIHHKRDIAHLIDNFLQNGSFKA